MVSRETCFPLDVFHVKPHRTAIRRNAKKRHERVRADGVTIDRHRLTANDSRRTAGVQMTGLLFRHPTGKAGEGLARGPSLACFM